MGIVSVVRRVHLLLRKTVDDDPLIALDTSKEQLGDETKDRGLNCPNKC